MVVAELTRNKGVIDASGAYQVTVAAAQAACQNQIATLEAQAACAQADAQYSLDIGSITQAPFDAMDFGPGQRQAPACRGPRRRWYPIRNRLRQRQGQVHPGHEQYREIDSDYGIGMVSASAAYSATLNQNQQDFTLSCGTVQNALLSDLVADQIQFKQYLQDKAEHVAAWWTDEGADLYLDWAEDVNAEHSACTTTAGAAYTAMTTAIATANNTHAADTPEGDPAGGDDQTPPTIVDPEAAKRCLDDLAAAESTRQKALSAAALQLALATEAAGQDAQALAAAQTAYDSSLAAADAQGDAAIANAQATGDYVDEVYGQAGDYETWQDALDSAESTYDLARSAALCY